MYSSGCGCGGSCGSSGERYAGLGWMVQAGQAALTIGSQLFGGGPDRHENAFCCSTDHARGPWPAGYNPPGTYPTNANLDGAPGDYRERGSPFLDASRHGFTRAKDDYCNCFPIRHNGRWWTLGEVRDNEVHTGPPQNVARGVWVEVDRDGVPLSVPGYGKVSAAAPAEPPPAPPSSGGSAGSGGSSGFWTPPIAIGPGGVDIPQTIGGGGFQAPAGHAPPEPSSAGRDLSKYAAPALGIALLGAALSRGVARW